MLEFVTVVAFVLVALIAVLAWVFVARHARTRWWASGEGRYLMKSKVAIALIFTMGLVFRAIDPEPMTRAVVAVLLYAWIAYTLAELLMLQTRARRERDRNPR